MLGLTLAALWSLGGCGRGGPDLVLTDAHNYSYVGELTAEQVHLTAGQDSSLSWDGLTTDMRGRSVDPATIDEITLVALNLTVDQVLAAVATNDLLQSDVLLYYRYDNSEGGTSVRLSDLSIIGNSFAPAADFIERDDEVVVWTWLATVWRVAPDGRKEILSSAFLIPDEDVLTAHYAFTGETSTFTFTPDLSSPEHLRTRVDLGAYTLDWSAVTTDSSGEEYDPLHGDQLILCHVDGDLSYAESELIRIFDVADAVYRTDAYALTYADLMTATTLDGERFPGFSTGGTWLIGVECTLCTSPAPLILAVVDAR